MRPVEEFMHSFLTSQVELRRALLAHSTDFDKRFYDASYIERKRRANEACIAETLLTVTMSGGEARVITSGIGFGAYRVRQLYTLRQCESGWRIHDVQLECGVCAGTGHKQIGTGRCSLCHGTGWSSNEQGS